MTPTAQLLRDLAICEACIAIAPVLAVRMSRANAHPLELIQATSMLVEGIGGYDVPRDAGHIRRRAIANRKRNKAARVARRANR